MKSGLFSLILGVALIQCGAQRELSGIWQQAPLVEGGAYPLSIDVLYELHLGHYDDRVTGLVLRYKRPESNFLSTFERGDRCECAYIIQGSVDDEVAFTLFDPSTPRGVAGVSNCALERQECSRIFLLSLDDSGEALEGVTWCASEEDSTPPPQSESSTDRVPIRFVRTTGLPINECSLIKEQMGRFRLMNRLYTALTL